MAQPNALQMPGPLGDDNNALAADAWDANRKAYADWLARDRQNQIAMGYVDPQTGALTPAGWKQQAQVIGGGFGPADIGAVGNALGTIKAYHGSPHSFDAFDMSKLGTGEGAQAYGHGLYFAENEGIARGYRDKLSNSTVQYGDKSIDQHAADSGNPYAPYAPMAANDIKTLVNTGNTPAEALEIMKAERQRLADAAANKGMPNSAAAHQGIADWLGALDPAKLSVNKGHMYEVNLNAEPDQMLHWDKPISEQHPNVENAVADLMAKHGIKLGNATGARVYQALSEKLAASQPPEPAGWTSAPGGAAWGDLAHDPTAAAAALRAAGIPGISYLDAGSRGAGQGSRNHVMFDDATIQILRKYGIAGLIGGGAAATAAGQGQGNQ